MYFGASSDSSSDDDEQYNGNMIIKSIEKLHSVRDATRAALAPASPVASTSRDKSYLQDQIKLDKTDKLLELAHMMDKKLQELEKEIKERHVECIQKLKEVQEAKQEFETQGKPELFNYVNCGKPYFKDKYHFPAPENEDTIHMTRSEMFDFSEVSSVPGWTVMDKGSFSEIMRKMSEEIAVRNLNSKIADLNRQIKKAGRKEKKNIKGKIEELQRDIKNTNKKEMKDIALPIDQDYDWDRVAKMLNRHSAREYESLWRLFLHPSINKNKWTKEEHAALQVIVAQHNQQDWEAIATGLDTGRSGYQCFVYFKTNMSNTLLGQRWTREEEQYLMRLIEYYKEGQQVNWGKVASCIGNRTKIQIYNKYIRLTESRKGRFVPEEDTVLLKCISHFGENFKKISNFLPGRSISQLRIRYNTLLKNHSIVWTLKEDKKLLSVIANKEADIGDYSSLTKYFPGKNRSNIRGRYITLIKWIKMNPGQELSLAPRRGPRRLGHCEPSEVDLNTAIQKLQKRLKEESEKNREKTFEPSEGQSIDEALALLIWKKDNETLKQKETEIREKMSETTKPINVDNLIKILTLLKAKLDKTKFLESPYFGKYPTLLEQGPKPVKMLKSYSRKHETHNKNPVPDIWGNCTLETSDYVFPPNYSLITGIRRLMEFCNEYCEEELISLNLQPLIRESPTFREFYYHLMDRFNFLFLWSILLSKTPKNLKK